MVGWGLSGRPPFRLFNFHYGLDRLCYGDNHGAAALVWDLLGGWQ